MKRIFTLFLMLSGAAIAQMWAPVIDCPVEVKQPAQLKTLQWSQGTTPLVAFEVNQRGRVQSVDTNMTVRMLIAPSATSQYFVVVTNSSAIDTKYFVQWPTIGTNTTDKSWWYTVYFERDGRRYWTGNGRLEIEATTSTADGLVWQEITSGSGGGSGGPEVDPVFMAWNRSTGITISTNQISDLTLPEVDFSVVPQYERDPRAMRLFHYGDPDIVITPAGDFGFDAGSGTITGYTGSNPDIVLPYEIGGGPVVTIGANAFNQTEVVKTLIAPKTLTTIGNDAFMSTSLETLTAPSLTSIGDNAFYGSTLTTLVAPSLTSIGNDAFTYSSLKTLIAPSLTSIGNSAFTYSSLKTLIAPSLTSIGNGAFYGSALETLTAPSLTSIGDNAFTYSSLKTLIAPSLTSIGNVAFEGSLLTTVYYGGNQPTAGANIYYGAPDNLISYVTNPQAQGWGDTFGGRPVVFPNGRYDRTTVKNITIKDNIYVHDSATNLVWRNVYSNGWHFLQAYTNTPTGGGL